MQRRFERAMERVQKPVRYCGREYNSVLKDPADVDIRFAFAFPDVYEVGMSHLGLKILYGIINDRPDAYCERAFAPWPDMEREMREREIPLASIETRTPLCAFDFLGFTLQYELSYTNALNMLELSGIPLRAADRRDCHPLVIAGGPCCVNPEPLAPFIDFFYIGEAEEAIGEILDAYAAHKKAGLPRRAFLERACDIDGVYVPSLYSDAYDESGDFKGLSPVSDRAPKRVRRRIVRDLDAAPFPTKPVVPYAEAVHDRITLELFRGCTRGCRFCQAGMIYRPLRARSVETLVELARESIANTGYDEISLASLSSGDYPHLGELIDSLARCFAGGHVSLSLPSLRIDSFSSAYLEQLTSVRRGGLTFAPEAGTQRLRDVINKNVTEDDLLRSVTDAFESGYSSVKLYFMVGLPTETGEDIEGIAALAAKVRERYYAVPRQKRAKGLRVTVSTSCFVPKPHTPFQWMAQDDIELHDSKQQALRQRLRSVPGVQYDWHAPRVSLIEAAFSRGDRRMADVLEAAFRLGCRLDGWSEHFSFNKWMQAFEICGMSAGYYANRGRAVDEPLPWDHIDAGVSKAYLAREWRCALTGGTTPDCREGCNDCGLIDVCGGMC